MEVQVRSEGQLLVHKNQDGVTNEKALETLKDRSVTDQDHCISRLSAAQSLHKKHSLSFAILYFHLMP
jgi:hypothetical protein